MISVKRYTCTHLVILGTKHPRIWLLPTQFQNFNQNSKIEFPGNKTNIFICPESEWFTELFPDFRNKKIAHRKKLWRVQIPEFNLLMTNKSHGWISQNFGWDFYDFQKKLKRSKYGEIVRIWFRYDPNYPMPIGTAYFYSAPPSAINELELFEI